MIICKTPYRISFFGGGSDYPSWYKDNGGEVISTSINKYIYLTLRQLPFFFNHKYRIVYSKIESKKKLNEINFRVVRELIKYFKIKDGLELHYDGDLPARSGMGSSSAFVISLINIFNSYIGGKKFSKRELGRLGLEIEHELLKEVVGSQDQIATAYGGFNHIKFLTNGKFKVTKFKNEEFIKKLNQNLVLIYTGVQRTASNVASKYISKFSKEKKRNLLELIENTKNAKKIIFNNDLKNFGYLMDENWKIKKSLSNSIANHKLNEIYQEAKKEGALGGKLLGAGGGGFFCFFVPKEKQKNFFKKKKLVKVKFEFENQGSQIIYNNA